MITLNLRSLIPCKEATELNISSTMSFALSPIAWIATLKTGIRIDENK